MKLEADFGGEIGDICVVVRAEGFGKEVFGECGG